MGLFDFFKKKSNKKVEVANNNKKTISNKGINIKPNISVKTEIINTPPEPDVVPVERRIKEMNPNDVGLYPHETLLLSYAPKYYVDNNSFEYSN